MAVSGGCPAFSIAGPNAPFNLGCHAFGFGSSFWRFGAGLSVAVGWGTGCFDGGGGSDGSWPLSSSAGILVW